MVAANAAEPVGAGATAGLDVGGFGAHAVGDGDFADGPAGAFGVQKSFGVTPEVVAGPRRFLSRAREWSGNP